VLASLSKVSHFGRTSAYTMSLRATTVLEKADTRSSVEYFEFPAPPMLSDVVRCVWLLFAPPSANPAPQPVVPDGCAEIVLNLADPFRRLRDGGRWETQPRSMVVGQITEAVVIAPSGSVDLLGIRLQPWGAFSVLPVPATDLLDVLLPLDMLATDMARDLPDELRAESTPATRAERVFGYLARQRRNTPPGPRARARAIVAEATRQPAATTVRRLAARLGLGERQVERELNRHVGLRPKMLLRIARFQHALSLARADESLSWSAVAARAGYYDQAHLTHEFRRFAACTPSEFLGRDRSLTDLFLAV
jgi:AraC-like DNA-binding protein